MRSIRSIPTGFMPCLIAVLALAAAGCGDDEQPAGESGASGEDATHSFTVAVVDPDLGAISLLAAIDELNAAGHDVESVEVAEPELAIEGLARERFQISGETTSTALTAAQQGAPVKLIGDLVANAWALWSSSEISSCEQLDGKRVGIFSQGSVATAMVKNWVKQTCPGTEPTYLVLGESSTRYAALKVGEIDATALELADGVQLDKSNPENLRKLADFAEDLPDLRPSTLYANTTFLEESPDAAQAFIDAIKAVDDRIASDPDYLAELIREHLPDYEGDALEATAEAYASRDMYQVEALTTETLEYTIDFFEQAEAVEPGLSAEDVADLRFLEQAQG